METNALQTLAKHARNTHTVLSVMWLKRHLLFAPEMNLIILETNKQTIRIKMLCRFAMLFLKRSPKVFFVPFVRSYPDPALTDMVTNTDTHTHTHTLAHEHTHEHTHTLAHTHTHTLNDMTHYPPVQRQALRGLVLGDDSAPSWLPWVMPFSGSAVLEEGDWGGSFPESCAGTHKLPRAIARPTESPGPRQAV